MRAPLVVLTSAFELPRDDEWLLPSERRTLLRFRIEKRRRDFRLGRFAAKRALALLDGGEGLEALRPFEIRAAPGGAPLAFRDGSWLPVALSISHSEGWASAGVQPGGDRLGCDLERIATRSNAFVGDYFTPREQAFVAAGPESGRRATLIWSAKEAVMKALGEGLRLSPVAVEVSPDLHLVSRAGWRSFSVAAPPETADLRGFWRITGPFVLTVAAGGGEPQLVLPAEEAGTLVWPRLDRGDRNLRL